MAKLRKIISIFIFVIVLFTSTSCLTLVENQEKNVINDFTTNGIISATFSVDVYKKIAFKNEKVAQGSGVIYSKKEDDDKVTTYYLLTNNHVVANGTLYAVKDCYGGEYSATLIKSDPNYDLAILKFNSLESYKMLNFVQSDVVYGDNVISVGTPNGQINAVTFGKVKAYTYVTIEGDDPDSTINFKVIEHDAPIYNGSSGGVLLNYNYEICGINYATHAENGQFKSGYAVSASKVLEFING